MLARSRIGGTVKYIRRQDMQPNARRGGVSNGLLSVAATVAIASIFPYFLWTKLSEAPHPAPAEMPSVSKLADDAAALRTSELSKIEVGVYPSNDPAESLKNLAIRIENNSSSEILGLGLRCEHDQDLGRQANGERRVQTHRFLMTLPPVRVKAGKTLSVYGEWIATNDSPTTGLNYAVRDMTSAIRCTPKIDLDIRNAIQKEDM
jgi:hypothetical protein